MRDAFRRKAKHGGDFMAKQRKLFKCSLCGKRALITDYNAYNWYNLLCPSCMYARINAVLNKGGERRCEQHLLD